jgi:membrane-associated phospholipid phosphatase
VDGQPSVPHDARPSRAYDSINAQPFVIVAALILTRQTERAYALIGMMAGALTVTSAAAVLLPALGPCTYFQIAVGDFSNMSLIPQTEWTVPIEWLRAAAFHTEIPPIKIGMISFPSYHAATAILFVWAAWRTPGFRWIALAINAAMLLATPVCGAHYFVDVLAGVAVAVIVIATMSWAFRSFCRMRFAMPARAPAFERQDVATVN